MFEKFPATSCGTRNHKSDCLCDVVVVKPVEIMAEWGRDSFMVKRLIEKQHLSSPFSQEDVLHLLELQVMLHDDVVAYNTRVDAGSRPAMTESRRTMSPGQMRHIEEMYDDGWTGKQIRAYCHFMWGLVTDRTNVSNIRRRAEKRKQQ